MRKLLPLVFIFLMACGSDAAEWKESAYSEYFYRRSILLKK